MVSRAEDLRFRELMVERIGEEATDELLRRMPVTPAENLATKDDIAALRGELLGEMGTLRGEFGALRADIADKMRIQTWYMATLFVAGIGATGGIVAAITA